MAEQVDHPPHYGGDDAFEAIKVMEAWHGRDAVIAFCVLNAEKYLCRYAKKGTPEQDLRKAAWYATRAADLIAEGTSDGR